MILPTLEQNLTKSKPYIPKTGKILIYLKSNILMNELMIRMS